MADLYLYHIRVRLGTPAVVAPEQGDQDEAQKLREVT
jgi:hypothetical protein